MSPGPRQIAGIPASTVSVAPSCQLSRPAERARAADRARRGERRRDDRVVRGDLGRRHGARSPLDPRRVLAQPRIGRRRARDPVLELPLDAAAVAVLVGLVGQVLDVALEPARRRGSETSHSPPSMIVGTQSAGDRYGWRGRSAHSSRSRRTASSTIAIFSIALTAPPSSGCARRDAGVAGPALDRDRRQQAAATGDPHVEAARLRDDRAVGLQRARHRRARRRRSTPPP